MSYFNVTMSTDEMIETLERLNVPPFIITAISNRIDELEKDAVLPASSYETIVIVPVEVSCLAGYLSWLRDRKGLKLKQLAAKTGLSISYLSDLERGRTQPSLETLNKIAEAYEQRITVIFGESEEA